ncbi:MAG: hypothetical protein K8J31_02720, partial [Anaerolineae bacterium]|nr:hypothetical protein [Anaerolineae bacterium]
MMLIREKPDWVKEQIAKLNDPAALERIDRILELDQQRRSLLTESEAIQAQRNRLNKGVGRLRGDRSLSEEERARRAYAISVAVESGDYEKAAALMEGQVTVDSLPTDVDPAETLDQLTAALRGLGDRVNAYNEQIAAVEAELNEQMSWVPNLPHRSVPVFDSEEHNIPWKPEGDMFEFDFQPRPHWELGPALDIIDFERGVKLAGTRSYILKGMGARLQRALVSLFLDMARTKGFTELYVPYMVQ